jgi:hypothetical protein
MPVMIIMWYYFRNCTIVVDLLYARICITFFYYAGYEVLKTDCVHGMILLLHQNLGSSPM